MIKVTVPKDIAPWDKDVEVCITKNFIERDWWLLLYKYLGYDVYFIYCPTNSNCIHPAFLFRVNLIFKFV